MNFSKSQKIPIGIIETHKTGLLEIVYIPSRFQRSISLIESDGGKNEKKDRGQIHNSTPTIVIRQRNELVLLYYYRDKYFFAVIDLGKTQYDA